MILHKVIEKETEKSLGNKMAAEDNTKKRLWAMACNQLNVLMCRKTDDIYPAVKSRFIKLMEEDRINQHKELEKVEKQKAKELIHPKFRSISIQSFVMDDTVVPKKKKQEIRDVGFGKPWDEEDRQKWIDMNNLRLPFVNSKDDMIDPRFYKVYQ